MSDQALPTADLAAARADLDLHGVAIVENVLSPAATRDVRERLLRAIERSEADGVPTRGYPFDPDDRNIRVFHLFNLDPVFVDLIQRPLALAFVEQLIGEDFLISNFSANITEPGNAPMLMHADQGYVPAPWPPRAVACNVAWLLDDMTVENGATRYVPGSHRFGRGPEPGETPETASVVAPAGSILVLDGRTWHQTGENRSADQQRAALFGYYVVRWLRPQVNWNAALWPQTVATLTPEFLHRLGFYTGNTEFQVPTGAAAALRAPAALNDGRTAFALAPAEASAT